MSMFNPEMMKNLMENEEIQKMMNDPNIMNNLQNMMGNGGLFGAGAGAETGAGAEGGAQGWAGAEGGAQGATCDISGECEGENCCEPEEDLELEIEDLDGMELEESEIRVGDKIRTKGLQNIDYNDKVGVVDDYISKTKRFVILFDDGKIAAIKEENLENFYQNIENID